jgi:EamA domain-containing membrane protein RarD
LDPGSISGGGELLDSEYILRVQSKRFPDTKLRKKKDSFKYESIRSFLNCFNWLLLFWWILKYENIRTSLGLLIDPSSSSLSRPLPLPS